MKSGIQHESNHDCQVAWLAANFLAARSPRLSWTTAKTCAKRTTPSRMTRSYRVSRWMSQTCWPSAPRPCCWSRRSLLPRQSRSRQFPQNTGLVRPTALEYSDLSIKVNASELGEVIGLDTARDDLDRRALEMLHTYCLRALVITLGSFGAIMATGEVRWPAEGPPVDVVSTVAAETLFSVGLSWR